MDIYNGAHHEAMNGNPAKVQTGGDAWNGEDFSTFTYEDRAWATWNPVPASLPNLRAVVGSGQYGVLVWRAGGDGAPTELHLPASFPATATTVVSDAAASVAAGQRLLLSAPGSGVHYALISNGAAVSDAVRAAALGELTAWVGAEFA